MYKTIFIDIFGKELKLDDVIITHYKYKSYKGTYHPSTDNMNSIDVQPIIVDFIVIGKVHELTKESFVIKVLKFDFDEENNKHNDMVNSRTIHINKLSPFMIINEYKDTLVLDKMIGN
jgi:hypothetical protein